MAHFLRDFSNDLAEILGTIGLPILVVVFLKSRRLVLLFVAICIVSLALVMETLRDVLVTVGYVFVVSLLIFAGVQTFQKWRSEPKISKPTP